MNISCSVSFKNGLKAIRTWKAGLSGNCDLADMLLPGSKSSGAPSLNRIRTHNLLASQGAEKWEIRQNVEAIHR